MSWHAEQDILIAYAEGRIDEVSAFSLEAHLPACPSCRAALASVFNRGRLDRVWHEVVDEVDRPRGNAPERFLTSLGVPHHLARLLAATPTLRLSWVLSVAVALGFAVMAARGAEGGALVFLVLAPLVPVAGVAVAYGAVMDPVYEIGLASPTGGFRLLLIRATAVLLTSATVAGVAALGLPDAGWTAAGWLLPALALTLLTLAMSTATSAYGAAGTVATLWVVGVTVTEKLAAEHLASFGPDAQMLFAVITIAALLLVVARREGFEVRRRV
ncbi:MAG: zf-HC2 domain-containing protein [Actinomycetota bacterium]|nr:zf-HC2 domain-containing protein [Actinomycetota bacterium]